MLILKIDGYRLFIHVSFRLENRGIYSVIKGEKECIKVK